MVDPISYQAVRMTGIRDGNIRPVILKDGEPSIQTVTYHWCRCDVCSEFQLINNDDLKALWSCPECKRSGSRKGTDEAPMCKGRTVKKVKTVHEPMAMTTTDPEPGRPCRMTPRCKGKARAL